MLPFDIQREIDIVLRDVRRWTQNLYLSENLRRRDDFGDLRIRKLGQLFIEIGGLIDSEYIKYRKQFSLRKKFVRFVKNKFVQITTETSQKLKNLKASNSSKDFDEKETEIEHNENGIKSTVSGMTAIGRSTSASSGGDIKRRKKRRKSSTKRKRKKKEHHRSKKRRKSRKRESVSHHGTPTNHSRARTVGIDTLDLSRAVPQLMPNRSN